MSSSVSSHLATDSVHILGSCPRPRRRGRPVLLIAALVLALGWCAQVARADGDPASDVLLNLPYFLPTDAGSAAAARQTQLAGVLNAAARSGFPMRVAIIAHPDDLGSVTPLWDEPVSYASFLGVELSFVYHGQLLVAMPDGLGLYTPGELPQAERSAIGSMPAPGTGVHLVSGAIAAVRGLAEAAGHPLSGSLVAASAPPPPAASNHVVSLIAFGGGLVLILLSWTASLRARPLRRRSTIPSAS